MEGLKKVALLGNPNSGKSSLFNHLTGLNQKVGNFPGVTVEKRFGACRLGNGEKLQIMDLPGTYSLYPKSMDEQVVFETLTDKENPDFPDLAIIIIDAANIKRNLLLFTQVVDLGIPVILVLNMLDVATNRGQRVSPTVIAKHFSVPTISLNARTGQGVDLLKEAIKENQFDEVEPIFNATSFENELEQEIKERLQINNDYIAHLVLIQHLNFPGLSSDDKQFVKDLVRKKKFNPELSQSKEIIHRYKVIDKVISEAVVYNLDQNRNLTEKLDKVFTHKIFVYFFFLLLMFCIFQSVFAGAEGPMDIIDAANIKRNLLLFTQVVDLGIPVILVLNMLDVATNRGQRVSPTVIAKHFSVPTISLNARTGQGVDLLKEAIKENQFDEVEPIFKATSFENELEQEIKERLQIDKDYIAHLVLIQHINFPGLSNDDKQFVKDLVRKHKFNPELSQSKEIIHRYKVIDKVISEAVVYNLDQNRNLTEKLDKVFTHKIFGYLVFLLLMFGIFQSVFAWAEGPMDLIDASFSKLSVWLKSIMPPGILTGLITEGIIPGIGGVAIFIPQIAILFAFISILEESGYMSRVVFLMDRIMRRFGLNGKSIVPLISGWACAIPAIMATRTIDNWKERLITIFVTPFMSCSARLPVYTILIALVVPNENVLGFLNLQGLALMLMYLLGFLMSIISAWIISIIVKIKDKSYFIMELPLYKFPRWKNVGLTIYEKSMTFTVEAGKIILAISIVLWVAASFGPGDKIKNAEQYVSEQVNREEISEMAFEAKVDAFKLENSFAGIFGKFLEPVIRPLGYDWKIGIALVTSFAAREVFVGTMATIYSIGSEDESTIKSRMAAEINPRTGGPMYTPAVAFSLMIFYAFAMQCMSTLAIVKKETNSWKWPLLQLAFMTGVAYIFSWIVYTILS